MNLCSSPGEECSWNQGVEIKPTNLHITFDQCMCHSLKSLFVDKYISFQEICRQCWQASETLINHQYSELAKLTFVHVLFKHYPFFQKMIILQLWKCSVFCWTFCFTLLVKFNARAVFEFTSYHNDACCIMHWLKVPMKWNFSPLFYSRKLRSMLHWFTYKAVCQRDFFNF